MDKLDAYSGLEKRENAISFLLYRYKDYFDRISKYADFSSNYVMSQVYEKLSAMYNDTVNKFNIEKTINSLDTKEQFVFSKEFIIDSPFELPLRKEPSKVMIQ